MPYAMFRSFHVCNAFASSRMLDNVVARGPRLDLTRLGVGEHVAPVLIALDTVIVFRCVEVEQVVYVLDVRNARHDEALT